jgi:hypothetical protein
MEDIRFKKVTQLMLFFKQFIITQIIGLNLRDLYPKDLIKKVNFIFSLMVRNAILLLLRLLWGVRESV